jgi:hypothetical protein
VCENKIAKGFRPWNSGLEVKRWLKKRERSQQYPFPYT